MNSWVARVEWETPDPYDEDASDLVMDHLAGHSASVSLWEPNTWAATVSIEAESLHDAVSQAIELVAGATAETVSGVEVLGEAEYDRRVAAM